MSVHATRCADCSRRINCGGWRGLFGGGVHHCSAHTLCKSDVSVIAHTPSACYLTHRSCSPWRRPTDTPSKTPATNRLAKPGGPPAGRTAQSRASVIAGPAQPQARKAVAQTHQTHSTCTEEANPTSTHKKPCQAACLRPFQPLRASWRQDVSSGCAAPKANIAVQLVQPLMQWHDPVRNLQNITHSSWRTA